MNVCFLVNKQTTIYYATVGRGLEERGHHVFWISPSRRWTDWLLAQGFARESLLSLPDFGAEWQARPERESRAVLAGLERQGRPVFADVVLMDRALRRRSHAHAYGYLSVCRQKIEPFLLANDIDICFGEATWAWEILTWMLCREIDVPVLLPHNTRVPSDRFAFFDSFTHRIPTFRKPTGADRVWAAEFLAEYRARPRKPFYLNDAPTALHFRPHWWKEIAVSFLQPELNRYDESLWPMSYRVVYRVRRAWNAVLIGLLDPFDPPAARGDVPFVLLCLHHQPEASIDVLASLHSNQDSTIERLARVIPTTHQLWVKEHPNGVGDRSWQQLSRLKRLPGVRLVHSRESTFDLIRKADLVVAPSGTVAYEAALLGRPSATLSALLYFNEITAVDAAQFPDPLNWPLRRLLAAGGKSPVPDEKVVEFLAWLHAQSFAGDLAHEAKEAPRSVEGLSGDSVKALLDGMETLLASPLLASSARAHARAPAAP